METDSRSAALAWNSDERAGLASHPLGACNVLDFRVRSVCLGSENNMANRACHTLLGYRNCDVGSRVEVQRLEPSDRPS